MRTYKREAVSYREKQTYLQIKYVFKEPEVRKVRKNDIKSLTLHGRRLSKVEKGGWSKGPKDQDLN